MKTKFASLACVAALLGLAACVKPEPAPSPPEQAPDSNGGEDKVVVWPDEEFRATRPEAGPPPELRVPEISTFELSNGLEVYLVKQDRLPTVRMTVEFATGGVDDPKGKSGATSLCMDLLDEATKSRDKAAFEAAQSDVAVSVFAGGGRESSSVGISSLSTTVGDALDLLSEMIREPGLRKADLDRLRARRKIGIDQSKKAPASAARRVLGSLVFGAKHPYGQISTHASLDKITVADCKRIVSRLKPDGARLFVVGQIDKAGVEAAVKEHLGKWKGRAPKAKKIPLGKPRSGTVFFIDVPGATQSTVEVAHLGPARDAPDYAATNLMARILGGSFSSRINMNLREDKGYSYGARAGFGYFRQGGSFGASSRVRADATEDSVRQILFEIRNLKEGAPTDVEMTREREGALAALPAGFATPSRTLGAFRTLVRFGLPLTWHTTYRDELKKLDVAAVAKAGQDHLQSGDFVILVAGDGATVREGVKKLADEKLAGSGGFIEIDADGVPVK